MKKAFLVLFTVAFVTSICFAEEASILDSADNSTNSTKASSNAVQAQVTSDAVAPTQLPGSTTFPSGTTTFIGKVDFVYNGDSLSEANPQITVKDDNGQGTTFEVASDATIIGKDGSSINLDWIDNGDKVSIEYITEHDSATKTAKSIKVLPD